MNSKPFVIAEVGCNHMGQMKIAKELIDVAAAFCRVDCVKFQKRFPRELLTKAQYDSPHPNPQNAYGTSYGRHREYLEFTLEEHKQLKEWCENAGVNYASSVWDLTSAREIASLQPNFIKIPSAANNNLSLLQWLCDQYPGEIQVSLGMTTISEEEAIVDLFTREGRNKDLVLFSCTSGYPVSFNDVCLLEIKRLHKSYDAYVKKIGFSGHHLGIAVDVAAYALGAEMIERHYTLDRTWKGTDHAASLEPDGLRKLVRNLGAVYESMQYKETDILSIEKIQREKLKYKKPGENG
jgi:N-acetylneuraminate synthase